jgi:hypothetical protein
MNPATNIYIHRLVQQAESNATSNLMRLHTARTLRQVADLADPTIAPEIRVMKHMIPALRHLCAAAERRAVELVDQQIRDIEAESGEKRARLIQHYRRTEWGSLNGNFPAVSQRVNRALQTIKLKEGQPT